MRVAAVFTVLFVALATATTDAAPETTACDLACGEGETCTLQEVQCITAPCDPVPTCVPVETLSLPPEPVCTMKCPEGETCQINSADSSQYCLSPCASVRCSSGYTCQVEQVQCIRAPCPPLAVCKPDKKGKSPYTKRVLRVTSNEH
ncbi:hypothetical protein F442_05672 [Phytophthora nicotianae P10297]|uniref:TIL domain-containing protein n=2 Tax=Phytophthora nicotianae TaxID=4792 RepID=W2ZNN1_PHYNI|nr:hypothetical protein L915_05489 [Phytophthora nicotianae]ETL44181.1 hypothetical protein L916_05434 [Phytophthora nicotianae]ETL97355.1 hypothetical protein L917_05318 [Phytophthora nicotianae]ETP48586.1 hypothetical protein F442_05672 [Phytophthora nicotianae P10297]